MRSTSKKVQALTAAASASVKAVPIVHPAANTPVYGGAYNVVALAVAPRRGRPVGSNTGRQAVVNGVLAAFARELQMPLSAIARQNFSMHSRHSWPPRNLSSGTTADVMNALAQSLSHATAGHPANVSVKDRAYAAGFIDGEGCISVIKTAPRKGRQRHDYRARFEIGQSDQQALARLQLVLGAHGKIHACKQTIAVNKRHFTLIYDGVHALHALVTVYPYLQIKANQAEALVRFWFEGRLWKFGPGVTKDVDALRSYWHKRLRAMK